MNQMIAVVLVLGFALGGCEKGKEIAPAPVESGGDGTVARDEAPRAEPAEPAEPCVPRSFTSLSGTQIQFLVGTRCAYSVEELQRGITIPYQVVVTAPQAIVAQPQDAGGCGAAGESGLVTFAEIGDGLENRWCICDEGRCGERDRKTQLQFGTYPGQVQWKGVNWTGPSDVDQPPGEPFPPGNYKLRVSAIGTLPAEEGREFRVEAELPILVTQGKPPGLVATSPAPSVNAPVDRWGAARSTIQGGEAGQERYLLAPDLGVFAVAEGSSSRSKGDFAAQRTVDVIRSEFAQGNRALPEVIVRANAEVHEHVDLDLRKKGIGASVAVVATTDDPSRVEIAHVGKSRIYRWRQGNLEQLTHDHLLSDDLINSGELRPEDLESFPYKGIASRAVGARKEVAVDVRVVEVEPGDVLLLSTPALHEVVDGAEMAKILAESEDLQAVAQKLRDLAKRTDGHENIAALLLRMRL